MTIGTIANFDLDTLLLHDTQCTCADCAAAGTGAGADDGHGLGCSCTSCNMEGGALRYKHLYGPPPAAATEYQTKEEAGSGAAQRSPDYYAQVIQVRRKTNDSFK